MKKLILATLCLVLLCVFVTVPAKADTAPVITLHPQSPNFPEESVASYTVKATGTNLHAFWYMEYAGKTYEISDTTNGTEPWEAYAGKTYGAAQEDANTFVFFFGGIGHQLNGATIWCVVEDGHYDAVSQKAHISIGNPSNPPQILSIPAQVNVQQGAQAEVRCVASAPGDTQLSFAWYETATGNLPDIMAMDIDGDCLFPDTGTVGTRYYVCMVRTNEGGIAYSSVVPVTVSAAGAGTDVEPIIKTEVLPEAVAGQAYNQKIACSDSSAKFTVSYNAGGANDFEKTGLTLSQDGTIFGTPTAAGSYGFTVSASNSAGDAYMTYILTVKEGASGEQATTPTVSAPEKETVQETPADTQPRQQAGEKNEDPEPIAWWIPVAIGVAAAGTGVGVAVLLTRKKSSKEV